MSEKNVSTAAVFLDKLLGGDLRGALEHVHSEVVVDEAASLPYGGVHTGHEGYGSLLRQIMGAFEIEVEERELLDAGDTVVARMQTRLTLHSSGESISMPVVEVYRFTDEQISRFDVFYKDTKPLIDLFEAAARPV